MSAPTIHDPPGSSSLSTPSRTEQPSGHRTGGKPRPEFRYRCRDFVDDEQRLIAAIGKKGLGLAQIIADVDGRKLVIPLEPLRDAAGAEQDAARIFFEKYGGAAGSTCYSRFRLVLDFIDERREEILDAGLADEGHPCAIREEFVRYLLNCDVDEKHERIPADALYRFLDEWGLRWM